MDIGPLAVASDIVARARTADPDGSCFTLVQGTQVRTADGDVPAERLSVGDRLVTCDAGLQPVTAVAIRTMWRHDLIRAHRLTPVVIRAGALGAGRPCQDLYLHPLTRLACIDGRGDGALTLAMDHVGDDRIDRVFPNSVTYVTFSLPVASELVVCGLHLQAGCDPAQAGLAFPVPGAAGRGWRQIGTVMAEQTSGGGSEI